MKERIKDLCYVPHMLTNVDNNTAAKIALLPEKTLKMIDEAFTSIDDPRTLKYLSKGYKNLADSSIEIITKLLNSPQAFSVLRGIPKHMTLQLGFMQFTPQKKLQMVRDQFFKKQLKPKLLLHVAKNAPNFQALFSLTEYDIFALYRGGINYEDYMKCPLNLYRKHIAAKCITIDHINEIKTFGTKEALKLQAEEDPIFGETVYELNSSYNLTIMPKWLNKIKNDFILAQVDTSKTHTHGSIFLNLVPAKAHYNNAWIYPVKKAYRIEQQRPECTCGRHKNERRPKPEDLIFS